MSVYKNCVNCGTQNLVDEQSKPTDKCYHCHNPIGVKVKSAPTAAPPPEANKDDDKDQDNATEKPPTPEIYVATGKQRKTKRPGLYKWRKRCSECEFHYVHDDITWCSKKKCPRRCPPRLRPQYRPKIEKPKATPTTGTAPESLEDAEEVCAGCPVLQAFKGYRMAVIDILGSLKKPRGGR